MPRQLLGDGKQDNYRKGITFLFGAIFLANIAGLIYFNFVTYQILFHSDSAVANLLAEEVVKSGSLFPKDWTYVHDDIFIVYGHLFIIPWLFFVKNGFLLHALSGIISAVLFLAGLWWLTGVLKFSKFYRLLALCVFSSGISTFAIEGLYGQVSYGVMGYLIFFQICTLFRVIEIFPDTRRRSYVIYLGLFCLLSFLVYLSNPVRAFLTYTFPIGCGIGLVLFSASQINMEKVRSVVKAAWPSFGSVIGAITLGWLCHRWLLNSLTSIASGSKGVFLSQEALGNNIGAILKSLLLLFGEIPAPGISAVSLTGFDHFSRFVLLVAMVSLPLAFFKRRFAATHGKEVRFLAGFFLGSFLPVLYLFIFTNIFEAIESSRYLTPAFIIGLLFMVGYIDGSVKNHGYGFGTVILLILIVIISLSGYRNFIQPLVMRAETGSLIIQKPTSPEMRLSSHLQSRGLHFGYASYWNASVITVLSGGDVTIRPVWLDAEIPGPRYHLSSKRWYRQTAHVGKTFLVLNSAENKVFKWDALIAAAGKPIDTYLFEDYIIYVFDSNFAATVFGWSSSFEEPQTLWYSDATLHTVGRFIGKGRHGWMESSNGEAGALVFGPYQTLDPGNYTASFDLAVCGGQSPVAAGFVDVSDSNGMGMGGKTQIYLGDEQWRNINVNFEVGRANGPYEFRVLPNGSGCLRARSVTIRQNRRTSSHENTGN